MAGKPKKTRSAAQRAATKKLVALNRAKAKSKARRSTSKRQSSTSKTPKSTPRKTNKPKTSRKTVVGKGKIPFINNPTVRKAAIGVGLGSLAGIVIGLISPNLGNNPLIRAGVGFVGGGPIGAVASLLVGGGLGNLGNLFGGGTGNGAGAGAA